jgi:hypothetical protein
MGREFFFWSQAYGKHARELVGWPAVWTRNAKSRMGWKFSNKSIRRKATGNQPQ